MKISDVMGILLIAVGILMTVLNYVAATALLPMCNRSRCMRSCRAAAAWPALASAETRRYRGALGARRFWLSRGGSCEVVSLDLDRDVAMLGPLPSQTNLQIGLTWLFQATQAPGASANVQCANMGAINGVNTVSNSDVVPMPAVVATNAAQTLKITTLWGSAGTGTNTIALNQLIVEALN